MNDEEFMEKLREAFAIEADEHLQTMSAGLIELEKSDSAQRRKEVVETIFREAHSLKGAARAVNRTDLEAICQALESVFSQWKREGASTSVETFDVLNSAIDSLTSLLARAGGAATAAERNAVQETVRSITRLSAPDARSARPSAPAPDVAPVAAPRAEIPAPEAAPPPVAVAAAAVGLPIPPPVIPEPERLVVAETVRVPMAKLDALLLRAEETVAVKQLTSRRAAELRSLTTLLEAWLKGWRKVRGEALTEVGAETNARESKLRSFAAWNEDQLEAFAKRLSSIAKSAEGDERIVDGLMDEVLGTAKQLIMLPFDGLLAAIPKQVRDLAREQGKEVDLSLHGGDVEIDKRILEEMKAPLLHLIRNAIDHGLEAPQERARRGKSPRGHLSIEVVRRADGKVEIVVSDDGGGIEVAAVKAAAVKNGTATEAEVAALDEASALALIFQSGISTSAFLTEISGRGLGMAIVREKVEKLGGQISIDTELNVGTVFHLVLPVTVATYKGVVVSAGGQTFVFPSASIECMVRVRGMEIQTVENRDTIRLADRAIALAWLADVLGLPRPASPAPETFVELLVLGGAERRVAFAVDSMVGEQEVVVKTLAPPLVRVRNVAAGTVLASGAPALILNATELVGSAIRQASGGAARRDQMGEAASGLQVRRLLVADDSVTSRMLLKNILETAGYQVTTAVDGLEAFTTLRAGEYDLVVSDVEMPRMDGFELTAKIRTEKKYAEIPVVLVTALSSQEHKERGIDVGANAYIVKGDFDQSNLLRVIDRLL